MPLFLNSHYPEADDNNQSGDCGCSNPATFQVMPEMPIECPPPRTKCCERTDSPAKVVIQPSDRTFCVPSFRAFSYVNCLIDGQFEVDDATPFTVGSFVFITCSEKNDGCHKVTAVDVTNNLITASGIEPEGFGIKPRVFYGTNDPLLSFVKPLPTCRICVEGYAGKSEITTGSPADLNFVGTFFVHNGLTHRIISVNQNYGTTTLVLDSPLTNTIKGQIILQPQQFLLKAVRRGCHRCFSIPEEVFCWGVKTFNATIITPDELSTAADPIIIVLQS